MAHYSEKRLLDEASNRFLEARGFQCQSHCGHKSLWMMGGACRLYIDVTRVINDDVDVYLLLSQQYYTEGREQGKQDALNTIRQKLGEWIFPRPAVKDEPVVGGLYGGVRYS